MWRHMQGTDVIRGWDATLVVVSHGGSRIPTAEQAGDHLLLCRHNPHDDMSGFLVACSRGSKAELTRKRMGRWRTQRPRSSLGLIRREWPASPAFVLRENTVRYKWCSAVPTLLDPNYPREALDLFRRSSGLWGSIDLRTIVCVLQRATASGAIAEDPAGIWRQLPYRVLTNRGPETDWRRGGRVCLASTSGLLPLSRR